MDPNTAESDENLEMEMENSKIPTRPPKAANIKHKILYFNIIYILYWHLVSPYGLYLAFTTAKWGTICFAVFVYLAAEIGITAGAHRLWSHKSFKATTPLQILLMIFNSMAFQNSVIHWARDHRMHHKYCDTDADPHNASRGFFYSHVGWLLTGKNSTIKKYGKNVDISDLYNNPVLRFQKDYALPVIGTFCFLLPAVIPVYFWGESFNVAWHINILRYTLNFNTIALVNSAAHLCGYRPYDKSIYPTQNNFVSLVTLGEGFHNYHHVFPWDYKTAELGNNILNPTTWFLNFCAKVGLAYDLKTVSDEVVKKRAKRTGDGKDLWGWDDKDITDDDKASTEILCQKSE